jgi:sec-independent protein translocase protein TatB
MFDIGWSEFLVIGVVALIAIGPKELPGVLRSLGHWMGKVRRMASDFQDQFREAMREAEVADLKRQFDEASEKATSAFNNPLETAQKEVEAAFDAGSAAAEPPANPVATTDPGAIEPMAEPAIAAPETQVSVAPEVPVPAAEPADTKPGGSA